MSKAEKNTTENINWLGLEVPRYTSYPPANHFSIKTNNEHQSQWLNEIKEDTTISVYVHIPFCRELCWFCGCHTKMTKRDEPIAKYVQILLKEIRLLKNYLNGRGKLVNIHFGGGSPSLLIADDLKEIVDSIYTTFSSTLTGEFAIELDPRTTTPENIDLYSELGFNRVSIGIQDFDPLVQKAVNRIQPYEMVISVIDQLRQVNLTKINCDLIYGLPYQTIDRFRATLDKLIEINPVRVALFSYAHVPHIKKHQNLIDTNALPSDADKLAIYLMAHEKLVSNGYVAIGIDHFAKADDPLAIAMENRTLRRNFQGYVTDATDVLIGFGNSAISQFPKGYIQNSTVSGDYKLLLEQGKLPVIRGWQLTSEDIIRKRIIDELMCFMSVDLAKICELFKLPEDYFDKELKVLHQQPYQEMVVIEGRYISIHTPYRMAARIVAAVFDQYRDPVASGRHSKLA